MVTDGYENSSTDWTKRARQAASNSMTYNPLDTQAVMDSFVSAPAYITAYRGGGLISFSDDTRKAAMGQ